MIRSIVAMSSLALYVLTGLAASAQSLMGMALRDVPPPAPEVVEMWRTMTRLDIAAAHSLVNDNHPAALPEVGDAAFREALARAHELALSRAQTVTTYEGYVATLQGMMNALGDPHLWARPLAPIGYPDWAGIVVSKRGDRWLVTDEDAQPEQSLLGAQVLSCDGRPIEELAREWLGGFKAVWSIEAQQIDAAPWLFVSERNPFVTRPQRCDFSLRGGRREQALKWRSVRVDQLVPRFSKATGSGAAGYGVRQVGDGYWIALEGLQSQAATVVAEVRQASQKLHAAQFVVLDMRGNGGGSSVYGRQIAVELLGKPYVEKVLGSLDTPGATPCDSVWRATPDNLRQLESYPALLGPGIGAQQLAMFRKMAADTKAARAAGRAFAAPASCQERWSATTESRPTSKRKLPLEPKLFLLTDHVCFSSCLGVTDEFRRLGAIHVGGATDANTRYEEVRARVLPSGLMAATTMMALSTGPIQFGPFVPAIKYEGDIADTPALELWIAQLAKTP